LREHERVIQAPVSRASLRAKVVPPADAKVDGLPNTEAIRKPAVVAAREGDNVLPRILYGPAHWHTCTEPDRSSPPASSTSNAVPVTEECLDPTSYGGS
jgi:hypothetical protein